MILYFIVTFFSFFSFNTFDLEKSNERSEVIGKEIFRTHCIACHNRGNNLIIPEKNLKKEALEANGMNSLSAITYQVINGKNGMPAFGGRLLEEDIEAVSMYVLKQSSLNFK